MDTAHDAAFAAAVLMWFDQHGRKDLPWKTPVDPYRIWVSEIMLQQTRVQTVVGYFQRFVARFPDVQALADASEDEVLEQWSGLGYYARCRNLHAAARALRDHHQGRFPQTLEALQTLPGIGRSTAAAILAQAFGQRQAILDGNVKRVLARYAAIDGWPGAPSVQKRLWAIAERLTPTARVADYTQAMMDLGAMVCVRSRPRCEACPVHAACQALAQGRTHELPDPKPKKTLPDRHKTWLLIRDAQGRVLLERRPPHGIWGGLWTFPELDADDDIEAWLGQRLGHYPDPAPSIHDASEGVTHVFSHFRLHARLRFLELPRVRAIVRDIDRMCWREPDAPPPGGVPAPVARLLERLADITNRKAADWGAGP